MKLLFSIALYCGIAFCCGRVISQEATDVQRFALLVGIDEYKNLSAAEQLDGSSNDISLVHSVLTTRFGFDDTQIIELVNQQATAAGIREAFDQVVSLVDSVPQGSPPAQVYFHFSGHGSQVVDQPDGDADRDEADGLDETLVPHDADRQGGSQDIRDDEINEFIRRVVGDETNPRAQVLLVYDCCHSGSGARGATKVRQLKRSLSPTLSSVGVKRKGLPPGVIFLSACHETEVEPEFRENGKAYGLLTRFLSQVLTEQESLSGLSYDLLHDAVRTRYLNSRLVQAPHPQLEAGDLQTRRLPFLGATKAIDRPPVFNLRKPSANEPFRLQAGKLHGLTVGSLLDVYATPELVAANQTSGIVEVRSLSEFDSQVAFVSIDAGSQQLTDTVAPENLSTTALAVWRSDGPPARVTRLKILIDSNDAQPASSDLSELPAGLAAQLRELAAEGERQTIEIIDSEAAESDLVLKLSNDTSCLFPATGTAFYDSSVPSPLPDFLRGGWGPFNGNGRDADGKSVGEYIDRIAKAGKLLAMVSSARNPAVDYAVEFEILQAEVDENLIDISPPKPIAATQDGKQIILEVGETYRLRIKNSEQSSRPVYVTALEVTPDMGIDVVAPYVIKEIKLDPGKDYICEPYKCAFPGSYYEVLLVTAEPHDFSFIAQADLPRTRGGATRGESGDLQSELVSTLFPNATRTRGRLETKKETSSGWLTKVIEWEGLPSQTASKIREVEATKDLVLKTRGAPALPSDVALKSIEPSPDASLTTSQTDEGYELVKVFYGTDREVIVAGEGSSQFSPPLIPIGCGLVLGVLLLLARSHPSKLRIGLTAVALLATCITTLQYVVTMQNRSIALNRTGVQYGRDRGQLEVGTCEISIPKDHRIGMIESPSIFSLEFREDPSKHVVVDSIVRTEYDEFFQQLDDVIEQSPRCEAMVFVHGFNVSFVDAARRTGQMAYDLKYSGAPIFFSWPSQATEVGYMTDEINVEWAVPHLRKFLEDIRDKTHVKSLNIIAHSMGNRAVTSVLKELHLEYKERGKLFNQVILAAPDVDADVFKNDIAPRIVQTANHVTLYASSKDQALVLSKQMHGYSRAGESGENLVIVDDVDTIDVTDIDTSLLGHNYYGDSDSIVADIYQVLQKGEPPGKRPRLKEQLFNSLKYWVFTIKE